MKRILIPLLVFTGLAIVLITSGWFYFEQKAEITNNRRTIYALEGMGQKHYYFQSDNLVIWLAAEANIADAAIQQLQEYYPLKNPPC